jgi:DNA-binding NtrC family response regulator
MNASALAGKRILAVDDEPDVLEVIEEILEEANVETARDFDTAAKMLAEGEYDLALLDVMGVDGLTLLEMSVERGIPAVIFTAHAMNVETFQKVIEKGAISFLPKERMIDLDHFINKLFAAIESGKEPWRILFDELTGYFDEKFGPDWKDANRKFWDEFTQMIKSRFAADRR